MIFTVHTHVRSRVKQSVLYVSHVHVIIPITNKTASRTVSLLPLLFEAVCHLSKKT